MPKPNRHTQFAEQLNYSVLIYEHCSDIMAFATVLSRWLILISGTSRETAGAVYQTLRLTLDLKGFDIICGKNFLLLST